MFMKVEDATPKAFSPHCDNTKVSMHFVMIQAKSGSTDIPHLVDKLLLLFIKYSFENHFYIHLQVTI